MNLKTAALAFGGGFLLVGILGSVGFVVRDPVETRAMALP
jgi:hypothetical protein